LRLAPASQTIDLGYRARRQFYSFHNRKQRWACLVAHRRAGKTVACIADIVDHALRCPLPRPRYAYLAPFFVQAKDVAWGYLKQFTTPIPGATFNEAELRVDLPNGARIRLYGADNYDRMRGLYWDGCILDEFADMPPAAWGEVIRPALADRQGWAVFIGTPKGRNGFYDIWERAQASPDWFSLILRASETGLLPQEEIEAIRAEMTAEQFEQELQCSFDAAILGAYYGKEIAAAERAGRICEVSYDPALPVHTAFDIGIGDSTAIFFFQVVRDEVHVIDHYEAHGHGLPHYAALLASKPYTYGTHFLPHDAAARELGTGRSIQETFRGLVKSHPRILPAQNVMDGINAARVTLSTCWFDAENCKAGLEALRQYRADYDEKLKTFRDRPKHDWSSHSADSFRYLSMAWRAIKPPPKPKPRVDSWEAAFGRGNTREPDGWRTA
jgi:phage terminase large subunit